jgi:hypothetical protein
MSRPISNGHGAAFDAFALLNGPRDRRRSTSGGFWSKVARVDGDDACWPWTGWKASEGYGRLSWCGVETQAHRVAYSLASGPIPAGMVVRHKCDNPPCCRPSHLELGTVAENNEDMRARGRAKIVHLVQIGAANCNAKLTNEIVRDLRAAWCAGESIKSIALRTGLAVGTVHPMLHGRTWRHVESDTAIPTPHRSGRAGR